MNEIKGKKRLGKKENLIIYKNDAFAFHSGRLINKQENNYCFLGSGYFHLSNKKTDKITNHVYSQISLKQ